MSVNRDRMSTIMIHYEFNFLKETLSFSMSEVKPTSELLSAIHAADTKALKGVTPVENPAAKHDMTMVGYCS